MDFLIFLLVIAYAVYTAKKKKQSDRQSSRPVQRNGSRARERRNAMNAAGDEALPRRTEQCLNSAGDTGPRRTEQRLNSAGDTGPRRTEQHVNSAGDTDYADRAARRVNAVGESRGNHGRQTTRQRQLVEEQRQQAAARRQRERRKTAEPLPEEAADICEPQPVPVAAPMAAAVPDQPADAPILPLPQLTPRTAAQALVMSEILGPCRAQRRR